MSTESTPLPVLLCGKIPSHIKAVSEIVKPEFEGESCDRLVKKLAILGQHIVAKLLTTSYKCVLTVVVIKVCSTEEHADSTIKAIMTGSPVDGTELPKPSIIIVGGGFSNEDVERFRTIESAKTVPKNECRQHSKEEKHRQRRLWRKSFGRFWIFIMTRSSREWARERCGS